jgi:hypothetical protein
VCFEHAPPLLLDPFRLPLKESCAFGARSTARDRDPNAPVVTDADDVAAGPPDTDELD